MKKNITINLFGLLYAIDEDAYELLKKYQDNMRAYFGRREGGEEIADDIEHRVAELFSELKAKGVQAITIEHVEEIIRRIGNPEEMDDDTENSVDGAETDDVPRDAEAAPRRKLYRDAEDVLLGGVMSGLSNYFGGRDPLPWRIAIVLLTVFTSGFFAIAYLVLWAFLPKANTAEERLRMHGKRVTPENLNEEIMRGIHKAGDYLSAPGVQRKARGLLSSIVALLVWLFKGLLLLFASLLALACVGVMVGLFFLMFMLIYAAIYGTTHITLFDGEPFFDLIPLIPGFHWEVTVVILSALAALGVLLYATFHCLAHTFRAAKPLTSRVRLTLFIVGLVCASLAVSLGTLLVQQMVSADHRLEIRRNMHDGHYISRESWRFLQNGGWRVVQMDNCSHYMLDRQRDYADENKYITYLHPSVKQEDAHLMTCHLERSEQLPAGLYRLQGLLSADGKGCFIYAATRNGENVTITEVPLPDDTLKRVSHIAWKHKDRLPQFAYMGDSVSWNKMREAYGWLHYVGIDSIRHEGGELKFGVSNDEKFTFHSWNGNEYSVFDLSLVRIGDLPAPRGKR